MRRRRRILHVGVPMALLVAAGSLAAWTQQQAHDEEKTHPRGEAERPEHQVPDPSFADVDRSVEVFDDPARAGWQMPAEVIEALAIEPGDVVADIGAGTGYFALRVARAVGEGGRVLAIDIEPNMVEHMRERAAEEGLAWVEPILVEPDESGVPEGTADVILMVDTYHHIHDRVDYLRRLRAALAEGGEVVVIDFYKRKLPVGPPPPHKMARDHVVEEFQEAGYRLAEEETFLPYQYFLRFRPRS